MKPKIGESAKDKMKGNDWDIYNRIQWVDREIGSNESLCLSNPNVPLPSGLAIFPSFLTVEEGEAILAEVDTNSWGWEGFEQRRRVQRYRVDDDLPDKLRELVTRLVQTTSLEPVRIVVEEFPYYTMIQQVSANVCTTFENIQSSQIDGFVVQLPLLNPALQHINRPKDLIPDCWSLLTPDHYTYIRMPQGSLLTKRGEALEEWRSRVSRPGNTDDTSRVVVVKFDNLVNEEPAIPVIPPRPTTDMPPMMDLLTIVVTTSPIQSNPSTEVLERTFDTFSLAGQGFLQCRKVIVCDGCRIVEQEKAITKKHSLVRQKLRSGIATSTQAENYHEFKAALKQLCQDAPEDSPFTNTVVEELDSRHGYGFALRHALRECVSTPYVCVIQHDRTFMRITPVHETLHAMFMSQGHIKYVGMSMRSNVTYRDIFLSKYGKLAMDQMIPSILRPPELCLDACLYGPESASTKSMKLATEKLTSNMLSNAQAYLGSYQYKHEQEWLKDNPVPPCKHQLSLTPTLFWYDNTHICETAHYRDYIYNDQFKMVNHGGFVEESVSPIIVKGVERLGFAEGHNLFGCYILDDHSGLFFTGHLDGGNYMTEEARKERFLSSISGYSLV
jgi:hypothetical protein